MQKDHSDLMTKVRERERIHSAVSGALRRKSIPKCLKGYDLIRGTVFGLIDHPEYDVNDAIQKAVDFSTMPGAPTTVVDAYLDMFECIEPVMRECDFHEGGDITKKRLSDVEIVERTVRSIEYDVRKEFCYASTIAYMKEKKFRDFIAYDILKNMIFLKLLVPESTEQEMYEYAYEKTYVLTQDCSYDVIKEIVDKEVENILPKGETLYEYVIECIKEMED